MSYESEMGQFLSEPNTAQKTECGQNNFVKYASSSMQGWRIMAISAKHLPKFEALRDPHLVTPPYTAMEDAHTNLLTLPGDKDTCFFGVFDGHGGEKISKYAAQNLHTRILSQPEYSQGNISEAIRKGFLILDGEMRKDQAIKKEAGGSTAICSLLKGGRIFCGSVGDSRAVASVRGMVEELSFDHKPANEMEQQRITSAGGWVGFNRVNGTLALSRALGDYVFKDDKKPPQEQIVTAYPDVIERTITPEHEFLLMACDGVWDVLTNQEVVDFVRTRLAQRLDPDLICQEMLFRCLASDSQHGEVGCDNMTIILVCFLLGGTFDDLTRKCSRKPQMKR